MRDPNQHVLGQLEFQLQNLLSEAPVELSNSMSARIVNGVGDRLFNRNGMLKFMTNYLRNGYGPMLDVDTLCESCDYDSQHWAVKPLFFGPLFRETPTQTINKSFGYYAQRVWLMQEHANKTGHICEANIDCFSINVDIVPNIWSRLVRAMLILRGLEYDAGSGYL